MAAKWGICGLLLAVMLLAGSGCRTKQPNLKPENTAEQLVAPLDGSYMSPSLPKQAMSPMPDPCRAAIDPKNLGSMPPMRGAGSPMMPGGGGGYGNR